MKNNCLVNLPYKDNPIHIHKFCRLAYTILDLGFAHIGLAWFSNNWSTKTLTYAVKERPLTLNEAALWMAKISHCLSYVLVILRQLTACGSRFACSSTRSRNVRTFWRVWSSIGSCCGYLSHGKFNIEQSLQQQYNLEKQVFLTRRLQ